MIDLHMHSTASDGTDTPEEIIRKCAKLGVSLSSITDHDTIDAQERAIECAARKKIKYLTGAEFSVEHDGELHILGYGMNVTDPELKSVMERLREQRAERAKNIVKKVRKNGMEITFADVERCAKGNTIGRPHIALALVEKGYAFSVADAFVRYLSRDGSCYVKREKLGIEETIGLIKKTGGIPVLAHPKLVRADDIASLIGELKTMGIEGLEAFYPAHTDEDVKKFLAIAKQNDLLVTSGSDYHGTVRPLAAIACEKRTDGALAESVNFLMQKAAV